MSLKLFCALGSLDSWVATFLDLHSVPVLVSGDVDHFWVMTDLILLCIVQVVWGLAVAFKTTDCLHEIITLCCTKVDGMAVPANEIQHVVSLIDITVIAHNLPLLLRGQGIIYVPG
jgi:hypothetical protein